MRWLRWLPRLLSPGGAKTVTDPRLLRTGERPGVLGTRTVGRCEACGSVLTVHSRRAAYRGRVDCRCGHQNHVQCRVVREAAGNATRHVSITVRRRFESASRHPDLRLSFRYAICPQCFCAIRLIDAHVIARANTNGTVETSAYYCNVCHVDDDVRRGQLLGHDRQPVVDTLRFL